MNRQKEIAKPLAYWIVAAGCILATVTALVSLPIDAYRLSWAALMLGIIPYVVYGSLTESLGCCPLLVTGIALIIVDITARLAGGLVYIHHTDIMPVLYLSLFLTLLVIPSGVVLGKLFARFWP